MTGNGFVERRRLGGVPEPFGGLVGVREVDAGARTVGGGRQVVRTGRARRGFLGHGLDLARLIRDAPEPLRRFGGRAGDRGAGTVQQLLTARPAQRRIGAQPPEDLREVVGAEDLRAEFAVFPGELVDDRQAGFVQFQRRPLDGGVHPRQPRVDVGPAGQPGHPAAVGRTPVRRDLRGQNFPVFGESRADDVGEQLLALRREVVVRGGLTAQRVGVGLGEEAVEMGDRVLDQACHREQPVGDGIAVALRGLPQVRRDRGQPLEMRLGRGTGADRHHRQRGQQARRGSDEHAGHGEVGEAAVEYVEPVSRDAEQDGPGDPVLGRKRARVDGFGPLCDVGELRAKLLLGLGGQIGQAARVGRQAEHRRQQRIGGEQQLDQLVRQPGDRRHAEPPVLLRICPPADPNRDRHPAAAPFGTPAVNRR